MLIWNDLNRLWFWLWCWRPFDFDGSISEARNVVMRNSFGAIWAVKLGKATSYVLNGIISLFIVLNKGNSCCSELPSY